MDFLGTINENLNISSISQFEIQDDNVANLQSTDIFCDTNLYCDEVIKSDDNIVKVSSLIYAGTTSDGTLIYTYTYFIFIG